MKLAGRCPCGVREDLAAKDREAHLECRGYRRCRGKGSCGAAKPMDQFYMARNPSGTYRITVCKRCACRRGNQDRKRRRRTNEAFRLRERARAKVYYARHRAARSRYYRDRYRNDEAFRARRTAYMRDRHWRNKRAVAA